MADQLTTQVTASTEVARAAPAPAHAVDPWTAIALVFGGIAAVVVVANGILSIIDRFVSWKDKGEEKDEGELAKLRTDLKAIEVTTRDFMPKGEILGAIAHEKENRRTAEQAVAQRQDRAERDISDMRVVQGQLSQQATAFAEAVRDLKTLVKEVANDLGGRIDKLQPRG